MRSTFLKRGLSFSKVKAVFASKNLFFLLGYDPVVARDVNSLQSVLLVLAALHFTIDVSAARREERNCNQLMMETHQDQLIADVLSTQIRDTDVSEKLVPKSRRAFADLQLPIASNLYLPINRIPESTIHAMFSHFSDAVSWQVMGFTSEAANKIQQMCNLLQPLGFHITDIQPAINKVIQLEKDSDVHTIITMLPYVSLTSVDVYLLLLVSPLERANKIRALLQMPADKKDLVTGLYELRFRHLQRKRALAYDPRQALLIRSVLQFSQVWLKRKDNRYLEIGYGNPLALLGLAGFRPNSTYIGVDLGKLAKRVNQILAPSHIELLQGQFPDDPDTYQRLTLRGPYSAILALDVIKDDPAILSTQEEPLGFARKLYMLLREQSVVIILNDYNGRPYFSAEDAKSIGFEVVRWQAPRSLQPAFKNYYTTWLGEAGDFSLTVLRRPKTNH